MSDTYADPTNPTLPANGEVERADRILFVDDSRLIRFAAGRGLSPHFDVVIARDGEEAWKLLRETSGIRAVITDLNMPRLDGVGLIERIRSSSLPAVRDLPILVVTSIEEAAGRAHALHAGANDLVPKPFTDRDLVDPIRRYLGKEPAVAPAPAGEPGHGNVERRHSGVLLRTEQALRLHDRHGLPVSFIHVRLMNHARIAERWGNAWAEATMRHVERQLADRVRVEDTVGRSAPDTFSLVLPATDQVGAQKLMYRLERSLRRTPARFPTGSVGLELRCQVQLPGDANSAERLLADGLAKLDAPNVTRLAQRATA